uniref:NADH-ubiquinone oxidoreductase chain 2 n=1 Tax=Leiodes picea TaxID=1553520 RepID=A0A343C4U3_9COLE|nr:NADH dehydrogenase subunit 2 [Leiodes picea]
MFIFTLINSTFITISANSWLGMWLGLEINLLSIIPLINNNENSMTTEASLKYFLVQAISSTILLFSIILMSKNNILILGSFSSSSLLFNTALFTKMGAAPFHFWLPEIMEGLNWLNCFMMLTWQKLAPMILLLTQNFWFLMIIIIWSMLISGIMGINQTSIRKIMAYSSINHIGWMISSMMINQVIWLYYFLIYMIISMNITLIFNKHSIFYLKQLFSWSKKNFLIKILFIMNFLSLGGLPPFLGFFPKWLTINSLIESNFLMISFIMVILTLLTLFYYMRLTFSTMVIYTDETKNYTNSPLKMKWIIIFNVISLMGLSLITALINFS